MFRQRATKILRLSMKMVQLKLRAFTHSETFPERQRTKKPCATGILAKRKRLIVSDTFVSKLSMRNKIICCHLNKAFEQLYSHIGSQDEYQTYRLLKFFVSIS